MSGADVLNTGPDVPDAPGARGARGGRDTRRWQAVRRLSRRTSLRTKLITAVLVLVAIAVAAISVATTYMVRAYLIDQHDSDLLAQVSAVNYTTHLPQGVGIGYASPTHSDLVVGLQQPGSQLSWEPGVTLPFMSNNDPLPQLPTSSNWANGNKPAVRNAPAQSGPNTWRVMAEPVTVNTTTGATTQAILVVAVDLGNINALTTRLIVFDLAVGGAILVVLAAVGAAVVQANLRPLNDIELTASQIAKGHLNHRIPERDPRTEIGSLGHSLNAMLSQIETAFHAQEESEQAAHHSEERMRRFIADASHELRTPLTTIRGFAEYYRQRGGVRKGSGTSPADSTASNGSPGGGLTPEDLDRIMHRLEAEASRMGLLVEDLLTLARLDQQRPLNIAPVDLLSLAADAVQDGRMVAPDRPIDLTVAPGAAFLVDGDEARLRQVIGNLVNNALTHTPPGTPIRVKVASGMLGPGTPAVLLDVEDEGPGMPADQARRVFERFYRADQARNRASGGTGLGLAIVAGLVEAHGGTVSVRTAPGAGADFQVRLPLSPDASAGYADDEDSPASARLGGCPDDVPQLADYARHAGLEHGEHPRVLVGGAAPRVRDVRAAEAGGLSEQPDPRQGVRSGDGAQGREVLAVHGEEEIAFPEPAPLELAGPVSSSVVAALLQLVPGRRAHPVPHVPVAGARAVHDDLAGQAGGAELGAEHDLGHRRAADVAEADAAHQVRPRRVPRRRQRRGGFSRHVTKHAAAGASRRAPGRRR